MGQSEQEIIPHQNELSRPDRGRSGLASHLRHAVLPACLGGGPTVNGLRYFVYHAVPTNSHSMNSFRVQVTRAWYRALRRRGQRHRIAWPRMSALAARGIPSVRILHPWPDERFDVTTRGKSPVR